MSDASSMAEGLYEYKHLVIQNYIRYLMGLHSKIISFETNHHVRIEPCSTHFTYTHFPIP